VDRREERSLKPRLLKAADKLYERGEKKTQEGKKGERDVNQAVGARGGIGVKQCNRAPGIAHVRSEAARSLKKRIARRRAGVTC